MSIVYPDYKSLPIIDEENKIWTEFTEFVDHGMYVKEGKRGDLLKWILEKFPLVVVRFDRKTKYWEYMGVGRMLDSEFNGRKMNRNFVWVTLSDVACSEACLSSEWGDDDDEEMGYLLDNCHSYIIDVIKKP